MTKTEFLRLIDDAIVIAQKYENTESTSQWLKEDCHRFIENMKKLASDLESGGFISSEGAGLGITRFLSESEVPLDLYSAGRAVEVFFREKMK